MVFITNIRPVWSGILEPTLRIYSSCRRPTHRTETPGPFTCTRHHHWYCRLPSSIRIQSPLLVPSGQESEDRSPVPPYTTTLPTRLGVRSFITYVRFAPSWCIPPAWESEDLPYVFVVVTASPVRTGVPGPTYSYTITTVDTHPVRLYVHRPPTYTRDLCQTDTFRTGVRDTSTCVNTSTSPPLQQDSTSSGLVRRDSETPHSHDPRRWDHTR